ncbi:MAG: hypothetical protein KC425_20015 [Anaerolineales bacterium]|nr:hypothetical protein [Anaerolineales bacterium]
MTESQPSPPSNVSASAGHFWRGLLAAVAALFTYVGWRVLLYGRRLFRQPAWRPRSTIDELAANIETRIVGYDIAAANVRAGIETRTLLSGAEKQVLCAGWRNFREPWARDFGFASLGLLAMQETQVVRESLEAFLAYQRPDGQFPVKIHSTSIVDRYMHSLFGREQPITRPLRPKYITAHNTVSLDGNCLLIIAALAYANHADDEAFARQSWPALLQALHWLESWIDPADGLLHQAAFTDWADSVGRTGRVLYTNVLYWKALQEMARAAKTHGRAADHPSLFARAQRVGEAVQQYFWRDDLGYFVTGETFEFLSSSGNLLAIAWELATPAQSQSILDKMAAYGMADPVPTLVTQLPYPRSSIALENRLAGIPEYHTHAAWLWLGAWHVVALVTAGRLAEARAILDRIDAVIVRDGVVHEVYGRNGRPLATRWYTAEAPLTWNAGMVVYAHHVLRQALQKEQA